MFDQVGAKVFYPKGEIQRDSYRTKDGKVRALLLPLAGDGAPLNVVTESNPSPLEGLRRDPTDPSRKGHHIQSDL